MNKSFKSINLAGFAALMTYVIFISWRLFFYAYSDNYRGQLTSISYNLIPFKTIMNYILYSKSVRLDTLIYNLAGNIAAFMPLGFLLPLAFKGFKSGKTYLSAFALIFTAEVIQLISRRGVFDVDDLLLNMLGSVLGYGAYRLVPVLFRRRVKNLGN